MTLEFTGKVILKFSKFILIKNVLIRYLKSDLLWIDVSSSILCNTINSRENWARSNKGTNFCKLGMKKVGQDKKSISKDHSLKQFFDCCSCEMFTLYSEIFSFMFFHDDSSLYTQGDWTKIKQNLNVEPLSRPLFDVFSPFSLKSLLQFLSLAFLLRFWTVSTLFFE